MKIVIGILIGAALGYANYKLIGCRTGACPLNSNPWVATIYGMVLGGVLGGSLR